MTEAMIFDMLRQALWVSVIISTPLLVVALVAGIAIGLVQALTSVQEMTITFVPKVGAMLIVFWATMSFMTATLVSFFNESVIPMIAGELTMDATGYTTLSRQAGLMREMQMVANNIANASTTGFRREGMMFSEHIKRLEDAPSLSMAHGNTRQMDLSQGGISQTGGTFDFAIQGEGFFLIETPQGQRLTRAGSFTPSAEGELVTPDGNQLLDEGGAAIFVPPDARAISLAQDGTLSADGVPLARVGLWQPTDPLKLSHQAGTLFNAEAGVEPAEGATLLQGFVEDSNVNPIIEVARMIEVQRAYEMGQGLLDREDERVRAAIRTLGR